MEGDLEPGQHGRAYETVEVGEQSARQARYRTRDDEGRQPYRVGTHADGLHPQRVLSRRVQGKAERRSLQLRREKERGERGEGAI